MFSSSVYDRVLSVRQLRGNPLMLSETLRRQEAEWENLGSEEGSRDREDGEKARLHTLGKVRILHTYTSFLCFSTLYEHPTISDTGYRPLTRVCCVSLGADHGVAV